MMLFVKCESQWSEHLVYLSSVLNLVCFFSRTIHFQRTENKDLIIFEL